MNALSKDLGMVIEYEYQEDDADFKALMALVRKLKRKKNSDSM